MKSKLTYSVSYLTNSFMSMGKQMRQSQGRIQHFLKGVLIMFPHSKALRAKWS